LLQRCTAGRTPTRTHICNIKTVDSSLRLPSFSDCHRRLESSQHSSNMGHALEPAVSVGAFLLHHHNALVAGATVIQKHLTPSHEHQLLLW
jgi:hypothetical protein